MKNKVINLFNKPQVVVPNQGVKYSGLLEQFLTPFMDDFADVEYYEDIFEFAINAWNFANIKLLLPEEESNEAINAVNKKDIDVVLLNKMIDYKILKFKEYSNFIVDFDFKETSGDPILSITTETQEQYLAKMIGVLDGETNEDDFEENYINRSAIIIKPRQPFLDWCSKLYPDDLDEMNVTNTYLISEDIEDIDSWLKKKYDKLFTAELESWHTNKKEWPQKRNYKMFKEWFQIDKSTMVYDLECSPVSKI